MGGSRWRWPRWPGWLLVPAAIACASLAGCGHVAARPVADPAARPAAAASAVAGKAVAGKATAGKATARKAPPGKSWTGRSVPGKPAARKPFARSISAPELRAALLSHVNGVAPVAPAASGDYASLPDGSAGHGPARAVRVIPAACGAATMTGFNPAVLAGSPAAAATFRVGGNGVSEMLVASTVRVAVRALAGRFPAACAHYRETVAGRTFRYTASESAISGIGQQALMLHVRPAGTTADNLWSLVYRGAGFVGSVTVVGPDASGAAVRQLGEQAYTFAARSLS